MGLVVKTPLSWLDLWLLNHPSSHLSQPFQMFITEQQRGWGHHLCCSVWSRRRGVLSTSNCLRFMETSPNFFNFFFFPELGEAFPRFLLLPACSASWSQGSPGGFRALLGGLTAALRELFGAGPCPQQDLQCGAEPLAGLRLCFGAASSHPALVWG